MKLSKGLCRKTNNQDITNICCKFVPYFEKIIMYLVKLTKKKKKRARCMVATLVAPSISAGLWNSFND